MPVVRLFALLWLALVAAPIAAQTFPQLSGRVVDQANLLPAAQEAELDAKLQALEAQSGRQLVIATVNSLEGRPIEDYGYRLGRHWAIGNEKRDDGVILLVAPNEKKVRIETGYGARVFLTDAVSSVIIRNAILPHFRNGDFAAGIEAGADQIIKMMSLSPEDAQRQAKEIGAQEAARGQESPGFLPVIFMMIIFFVVIRSLARRAHGRRYRRRGGISPWVVLWGLDALSHSRRGGWGGGGFGGFGGGGGGFGGFSGGGGSFGGGGASGGW